MLIGVSEVYSALSPLNHTGNDAPVIDKDKRDGCRTVSVSYG
jgi:hypothetical protein